MAHRHSLPLAALAASAALLLAPLAHADVALPRLSPGATVVQTIGLTDLTVKYSRPGVKARTIWGDLVPWDKPWRTGANEATTITTTSAIQFGGKPLAPGTYALLTIPGREQWSVILNSEKDLWGAFEYKPEKNVLELKITPVAADSQEWMEFAFENLTASSADLVLRWEKLRLSVPIVVDVNAQALANIAAALDTAQADNWRTPYQAANWSFQSGAVPDQGGKWLQKSLSIQKNYTNLSLSARWQMKAGKRAEAIATAKDAIAAGKASKEKVDTAATEKLLAEWETK